MLSMPGPTMYKRKRDDVSRSGPMYAVAKVPAYKRRRAQYYPRPRTFGHKTLEELKFFDRSLTGTITSIDTWDISPSINTMALGTSAFQRIGRKVRVRQLHFYGVISAEPNSANAGERVFPVRLIVYQDRQANGAAATTSELFDTTGPAFTAFRQPDYGARFRFLCDKRAILKRGKSAQNVNDMDAQFFEGHYDNLDVMLTYDTDTSTISDLTGNNFGVAVGLGSAPNGNTTGVNISYQITTRVRYLD